MKNYITRATKVNLGESKYVMVTKNDTTLDKEVKVVIKKKKECF